MNKEYMKIKNCVYVTEDDGLTHTRRYSDNIEKILTYENRYDVLDNLIREDKKELNIMKNRVNSCKKAAKIFLFCTIVCALIAALPIDGVVLSLIKVGMIPMSAVFCGVLLDSVFQAKIAGKEVKGLENKIPLAENERIKVRDELINLKIIAKEQIKNTVETQKYNTKEEEPCFIELDGDKDYLEKLELDLNVAYETGINSKPKTKVLKK